MKKSDEKEKKGILEGKEDNEKSGQAGGGGPGGEIQEKVDNTKKKVQKIKKIINFLKRHPLIAKVLFWIVLAIVIIIFFTLILYTIFNDKFTETSSMAFDGLKQSIYELNTEATDEEGNEETSSNAQASQLLTGGTILKPEGADEYKYYLVYGNYTEDEKKEKVNRIKNILKEKNIEIYSNQCLLFLAELEEHGLELDFFSKEELEALYMFYKAEVATSSFDLRPQEKMYVNNEYQPLEENIIVPVKETSKKNNSGDIIYDYSYQKLDFDENDYSDDSIYGTIRVQRVTYDSNSADGQVGTPTILSYLPYEEFINYMGDQDENNKNFINKHFTIDEENNLIVAGWNNVTTTYTVTCEDNQELKKELEQEYKEKEIAKTNVYKYKSIPYLNYVSKYTMPFSFLMSLLATTDDVNFCKELAKIAETSYITITLHEEYSRQETINTTEKNEENKTYASIYANVGGTVIQDVEKKVPIDISKYSSHDDILNFIKERFDYNPLRATISQEDVGRGAIKFTCKWKYEINDYTFCFIRYQGQYYSHTLTMTQHTQQNSTKNKENVFRFITKERKLDRYYPEERTQFIQTPNDENYKDYTNKMKNLSSYTKMNTINYTIKETTINEYNSYSMEVTEVSNWYEYYKKTYSEVKVEPLDGNTLDNQDSIMPTIENISITDPNEISNLDYIKEIKDEQKKKVVEEETGLNNFTNMQFDIVSVRETKYSYGTEKINIVSSGYKYKRAGTEKEIVQVKVQDGNHDAVLTVSADAITVYKNLEEAEVEDEDIIKEEIYETTDEYNDGFLNVYDKYDEVQKTLNSIEEWTYEMLDLRSSCINITELLKYLLFLYDGTNLGVREYDVQLLKPNEFKSLRTVSNALAEVMKSYEADDLMYYMNGTSNNYSDSVRQKVTEDRTHYKMYWTEGDNCLNFSYGIMVYIIEDNELNNEDRFDAAGYTLQTLVNQYMAGHENGEQVEVLVPVEVLDKMYSEILSDRRNAIKSVFDEKGINIKSYELDALTNVSYQYGNCGERLSGDNNIAEVYRRYILEPQEPDYEGFFNNAVCDTESGLVHFFNGRYINRQEYTKAMFKEGRYFLNGGQEISTGAAVVEFALDFVGQNHETFTSYNPTNEVEDIWYGADWCAMFVSYCYNECRLIPEPLQAPYAGCTSTVNNAKTEGIFIDRRENPDYIPEGGDIIFFTNDYVSSYHTGLVVGSDGINVYTVEGNTGVSNTLPYWQGSHVEEKTYTIDSTKIYGYIPINR